MTTTTTAPVRLTPEQIRKLAAAGCAAHGPSVQCEHCCTPVKADVG